MPSLWLVDPDTRVLEALVGEGERSVEAGRFSDGDVVRIPPFEAIELDVARILPPPPASPGIPTIPSITLDNPTNQANGLFGQGLAPVFGLSADDDVARAWNERMRAIRADGEWRPRPRPRVCWLTGWQPDHRP
ncbi:MAG: hypothetical protein OHK0013_04870 [Sandaracinaceae bacterium]